MRIILRHVILRENDHPEIVTWSDPMERNTVVQIRTPKRQNAPLERSGEKNQQA